MEQVLNTVEELKEKSDFQKLADNLLYATSEFQIEQLKTIRLFSLTFNQYNILQNLLDNYPRSVSLNQISDSIHNPQVNVSRVVDSLIKNAYLTRVESSADRRKVDVKISPKGIDLLSEISDYQKKQNLNIRFTENEMNTLNDLLKKFRNTLTYG